MKLLRPFVMSLVLAALATMAGAATVEMANLVPHDAKALLETVNLADLRQMLLESKFWAALEQTQACQEWRGSRRYQEMRQRIDQLLDTLKMDEDQALKTYLGGRSAVVLLPSGDEKKPYGVILTEATNEMARRLAEAVGGTEVTRHRDVAIWEVRKEKRVDRMAFAGDVLLVSGSEGDAIEKVLDVIVGGGAALGTEGQFRTAVQGLPEGWRVRAYAASVPPRKLPGAAAMYPKGNGRVHFEWRLVGGAEDLALTQPVALAAPNILPDKTVAAVASAFYPEATWNFVKAKIGQKPTGPRDLTKADLFVRSWFPGYTMEGVLAAFGPEAAAAVLKGESGGAPGLLGMVKLTAGGGPVAKAFKDGLASKAMLLAALSQNNEKGPKLNVREEAYGQAQLLIVEAPEALEKLLGEWAKDIGLTVAVTDQWLIVGTTPAGVKATLDAAAGKGNSLAAGLAKDGEKVPTAPVTRWGVIAPAKGADIVLSIAEKLAGKERVDQARKATNLAELLKLVKYFLWQRTDAADVVSGTADIQAID